MIVITIYGNFNQIKLQRNLLKYSRQTLEFAKCTSLFLLLFFWGFVVVNFISSSIIHFGGGVVLLCGRNSCQV